MAILDELKQRLAVSLAQRTGLNEIQEQIFSIQEKLDWLMEKNFAFSEIDYDSIKAKILEKPLADALTVVFITDESYFDITLVALWTLFEHQNSPYNVKLVAYRCTEAQEQLVKTIFPNISVVQVKECAFPFRRDSHVSEACMLKLVLPRLFPNEKKVLFIDCDTLIEADLHELDNALDTSAPLAGVRDAAVMLSNHFRKNIFPKTHSKDYINSGVMLINLEYWRNNDCTQKMFEMSQGKMDWAYPEQDILNIFFAGKLQFLPYRYNIMKRISSEALITDYQLARIHQRSIADIQAQKPAIFHISGPNKPWNSKCAFKYPLWREESGYFMAYCKHIGIDNTGQ